MGKKAPDAPDMSAYAAASERAAQLSYQASQDQLAWAKEMWGEQKALLEPVLNTQLDIMRSQYDNGMKDRARYESLYQPLEENLVQEFQNFDTPERRAQRAGEAQASVAMAQNAQRNNALARLEGFGIDPSQTRSAALDRNLRAMEAAQQAAAGNIERRNTEALGRSLRAEAINIGRGYPSQVAGAYGQTLQAGTNAVGNMNNTVQTGANTMGTGMQWMGLGLQGTNQAANITNMGYQNQLAQYNANSSPLETIAGLGGTAARMYSSGMFGGAAQGGAVPDDLAPVPQEGDVYPTKLKKGEFVLPEEAVRFYGEDKIRKMVAKARAEMGIPEEGGAGPRQVEHPRLSRDVRAALPPPPTRTLADFV